MLPAAAAAVMVLLSAVAPAAEESLEYPVKATYLYKFAPFVEWPAAAFETPWSPVELCIVGDDPFGPVIDRAVSGQRIAGRPIAIRRLDRMEPETGCHIAYAAGSAAQPAAETLAAARGVPVLTVTDAARGPTRGIIHFVVEDNRVRFEIDNGAARENGIAISSKLLSLAVSVRPG
jgi:hypothetical protein